MQGSHEAQSPRAAHSLNGTLRDVPVVGIIRGYPSASAVKAAQVAAGRGLRVVEVTLDSPGALASIEQISRDLPDVVVGVGTVTKISEIEPALEAGARFVVTPALFGGLMDECNELGVPVIPGAMTPSEILSALDGGATAVKVFPAAQAGGPAFLSAVRAPLGDPPLIPTGGVTAENASAYLDAGAMAVGAGSGLFRARFASEGDWGGLASAVDEWLEAVR